MHFAVFFMRPTCQGTIEGKIMIIIIIYAPVSDGRYSDIGNVLVWFMRTGPFHIIMLLSVGTGREEVSEEILKPLNHLHLQHPRETIGWWWLKRERVRANNTIKFNSVTQQGFTPKITTKHASYCKIIIIKQVVMK